jgi:hypothetical protein
MLHNGLKEEEKKGESNQLQPFSDRHLASKFSDISPQKSEMPAAAHHTPSCSSQRLFLFHSLADVWCASAPAKEEATSNAAAAS